MTIDEDYDIILAREEEEQQQEEEEVENIEQGNNLEEQSPELDIDEVAPKIEVDELIAEYEMHAHELEEFLPPDTILTFEEAETETEDFVEDIDDVSADTISIDQDTLVLEVKVEVQEVEEEELETYELIDTEQEIQEEGLEPLDQQEVNISIENDIWEEFEENIQIIEEEQEIELSNINQAIEELTAEVEVTDLEIVQLEKELESIIEEEQIIEQVKETEEVGIDELEGIEHQKETQIEEKGNDEEINLEYEKSEEQDHYKQETLDSDTSDSTSVEATEYEEPTINQELEEIPVNELEHQTEEDDIEELEDLEETFELDELEEETETVEITNDVQPVESEDELLSQQSIMPPEEAYSESETIENTSIQLSVKIPISQSIEIAHSDNIPQQQSFGLSFDEGYLHNFSINLLDTEISTLEKLLEEVESPRLLEQFHTDTREEVHQLFDVESKQIIPALVDSRELNSQKPTLPEPPPYDFQNELEKWEEEANEQPQSIRGQLLRSLERAKQIQLAASLNFERKNLKQVKGPRKSEPLELKKDDLVKVDGKKINLALNYNHSMLEFTVIYRKLIIYKFLKKIFQKSKTNDVEAVIPRKTKISKEVRSFITKEKIQYTDNIGFGREAIQTALKELISENILEIKIIGYSKNKRRTIKSLLMEYNGVNIEDSFRYMLGKIINGFHETYTRKDASKIMINRLIEDGVLPTSVDGKKLLSYKKSMQITNWESYSAKIDAFALFEKLYSFVITKSRLPSNTYFKTMLKESVKKGKDRFFINTGELKDILSEAGKDISNKYHMLSETVRGGGKGQHDGLPALNKKFKRVMKDNKSFIHPDLNTAKFKRSVLEHRKNFLSISQDIKGTVGGKEINVITKASRDGNFPWQYLEQLFVPGIRLTQFIEYDPHTDTGKIYTAILDNNTIKLGDKPKDYLNHLNTVNKIFHEFIKKAKKVGGGAYDWINEEVFQKVENLTIKNYNDNSIERELFNEISGNLRSLIERYKQDNLTRNQFYQFWVETLKEKISQ
ncbi:MAG: hypothetical protein ACXADY_25310 [Candidatus Hodarchaeales archaeon]|jgi:hypothetical protein